MTSSPDGGAMQAKSDPVPDQAPTQEQVAAPFRQSKICICVDVSGSTYGPALKAEIKAIKQVCSLIPQSMYDNITIIPWNDASERPRSLSQIHTLESGGGTDPNVLLEDPECRLLLQEADFWFLMTDGEIDQSVVRQFARNLTDYGMHGKACIISVFGEKLMKPSHCNITVGLSVFAVSPHVVFMYTDIDTSKTTLLSTKGCFSNLLPAGKRNPTLDYDTNWSDLPFVSYENLTRISVPRAQKVDKDELILYGNTRVNFNSLVSRETIDEDLMRQIMLNEDNIKTIALTAKIRGESDKLTKWLDKVDAKIEQDSMSEAFGHKDSQLLKDTIAEIGEANGTQVSLDDYGAMRYGAQNAYAFEPCPAHISFPHAYHQEFKKSSTRMRALTEPNTRLAAPENIGSYEFEYLHSLTPSNDPWTRSILLPKGLSQTTQPDKLSSISQTNEKPQSHEPFTETTTGNQGDHLNLAIAGFLKPTQAKDQHILDCPKCGRARAVMTLLLRAPDQSMVTKNFPSVNSTSKLVYPLTMGNYPEMDIISDTIICDKCAVAMIGTRRTAHKETLVAALPLVSYSKNQDAWLQTVNIATDRRFHRSDLAQVFLSIIFSKIERLLSESSKVPNLHNALNWQATMIQSEVVLQLENFPHVCQLGVGLLNEVILRNYRDCLVHDKFPLLLSYPLDGFIVTNAALSNSKYSSILSQPKRRSVVLLRFLYHLLENCCAYEQENGPLQLHAAKTLILLMDDPSGPRSLFKWRSLRAFSFRFDSLQDLQKYLSNHAVMDRYRLSLTAADLLDTPLLTATGLAAFRRLGPLFSWIEREAGNAIAVFVHYLMRLDTAPCLPSVLFQKLRERQELKEALADPGALSARAVERLIKPLTVLQ
ncbi:uncharacterized protein FPRO_05366 [Fusarium proliferatum ET1]|uniref:VWFA domain-containing protein n=1 Tax=Fusarium proliferatum (strain ET1) TaxID=1227346 RepID=A0A1L7VKT4_FUSPR|nr:uncharacterized protein FPRO_05366 [Fusarium proliferatum ET1]CZR40466.1 uncharacterized protein FPRO_05366 [Fusarium proliferatum ET1]